MKDLIQSIAGQTIVSIQPVDDGPLDIPEFVAAMALASEQAGARCLRIEGIDNLTAVRKLTSTPVVGIIKRDLADSPVRITPFLHDVDDLIQTGANIVAFDATDRKRPVDRLEILNRILTSGVYAMADCSNIEDAQWAQDHGCHFIGTTMSGYLGGEIPSQPDFDFLQSCVAKGMCTIAEGRYNSPELAAKAIELGAHAVTVGSAITRLEHIIGWFNHATTQAYSKLKNN